MDCFSDGKFAYKDFSWLKFYESIKENLSFLLILLFYEGEFMEAFCLRFRLMECVLELLGDVA